jgi:hypothetical protein
MPNYYEWTLSLKDGTQLDSGLEWADSADEVRELVEYIAGHAFGRSPSQCCISVKKRIQQEKPIEEMELGELFDEAYATVDRIDAASRRVEKILGS